MISPCLLPQVQVPLRLMYIVNRIYHLNVDGKGDETKVRHLSKEISERASFQKAITRVGYQLLQMRQMSHRITAVHPEDKRNLSHRLRNLHRILRWMQNKADYGRVSSLVRIRVGKKILLVNRAVLVRRRTRIKRYKLENLTMRVRLQSMIQELARFRSGIPLFLQNVSHQQKEKTLEYLTMFHQNFSLVTRKIPIESIRPAQIKKMACGTTERKRPSKQSIKQPFSSGISENKNIRQKPLSTNIETKKGQSKKTVVKESEPPKNNLLTKNKPKLKVSTLEKKATATKENPQKLKQEAELKQEMQEKLKKVNPSPKLSLKPILKPQKPLQKPVQEPKQKVEKRVEKKIEQKVEQKVEKKMEQKVEQKLKKKVENKTTSKPMSKPEPKSPSKPNPFFYETPFYEEPMEKNTEVQEDVEADSSSSYSESMKEFIDAL